MKYESGMEVLLGDVVTVEFGVSGVVVCDFASGGRAVGFETCGSGAENAGRGKLRQGVLINARQLGLLFYEDDDDSMKLFSRARA